METNTNQSDYRQNNSGLLRFRSAPTSFLDNFVEKNEKLSSGFCGDGGNSNNESGDSGFGGVSSQLPPQYPRQLGMNSVDFSMGMDDQGQVKIGGSSLMRQNSSPAGLFSHLTSQNGYATMRGIGSYRMAHENSGNGDSSPSPRRLKNHTNLSSRAPRMLARITEVENENVGPNDFNSGFPFDSWNDSSNFPETFGSGIKREMDIDQNLFANIQIVEPRNRPHILSHHSSLPKNSSEMEKLLQSQDTVPCKLRAKRGCATHPRSIAERVRRTKISERMRKLQELVPNMDKQTNTSDMLDLAVEYIKDLQKQYKSLSDSRANCKCSASREVFLNQTQ